MGFIISPLKAIKKRTLLLLLLVLGSVCSAQQFTLSGTVKDAQQQPIGFTNVVLKSVADSTAVKAVYTDEAGHFEFKGMAKAQYTLRIATMGFAIYETPVLVNENTTLPDIVLTASAEELDAVVINQKRPVVKRKIDRLEFDVENSILSSENAWEILTKTPGVNSGAGGLSVRGSTGILVTINDKKVYLTGTELRNLLENTNGDDIKSIEVITTPPSKYEAQGSAVINIKMKKNVTGGYKGSVAGAYVQSKYPKGVVSTNQYYKGNRFSVNGGLMFGSGHYYGETDNHYTYLNPDGSTASEWKGKDTSHFRATQQQTYNINAEYIIDTLNTVSFGANGFGSLKSTANINTPTYIYNGAGQLDSLYNNNIHRNYPQKNNTVNASFEHRFNNNHKVSLSGDLTRHYFNQDQQVDATFSLPDGTVYRENRIDINDIRRIDLFSAQADYTGKAGGSNLEAGFRYGNVDARNTFDYLSEDSGNGTPGLDMQNRFLYDEHIFAGYISADKEIGKWGFKAGLRGEHTRLKGNSVTTNEVNRQDYFKLFPTLYVMYKATDNNEIGLSYGKRIVRPQYASLNPFRLYSTPYSYSTGDPKLQPGIVHNLSLTYTLNAKYNFDLYYQYEKDPSMEIAYQDYETNTIISQFTNIDKNTALGLGFNTSLDFFTWWQNSVQVGAQYKEDTFQGIEGGLFTNKRLGAGGSTHNRFVLDKKKTLFSELFFYYNTQGVQGTYTLGSTSSLQLSVKKTFLNGNGELSLIFSDVYRGQVQRISTNYDNQRVRFKIWDDSQSFRIQFRYRFGNQNLNAKARQNSEEHSRL